MFKLARGSIEKEYIILVGCFITSPYSIEEIIHSNTKNDIGVCNVFKEVNRLNNNSTL